jgi:hypothetical protein
MSDDGFERVGTENVSVHRGDDKIPRDHLGRYRLPDPTSGKVKSFTRVTTVSETLKDRRGLEKWDQRNIIYGIGQRPALYAQAAASKLTDRKTLDGIAKRAREAADADAGADLGSALHTFTERIDRGERFEIHEPFASDIQAYRKALELTGIVTALGWIERPLFVPVSEDQAVVGTCDRVNNAMEWKLPRIGDVKTATDKPDANDKSRMVNTILRYGMVDIPLQLAMYAHATHWWDVDAEQWADMPAVDQTKALVFHVPAGLGEARIYEIDIVAGWEAVTHAMWERAWRRRKDLYETLICVDLGSAKREPSKSESGEPEPISGVEASRVPDPGSTNSPGGGQTGSGDDGASTEVVDPKGDEAASFPAEDSPASPSPGPDTMGQFRPGWEWAQERVNAIKAHEDGKAKARLAGLWSLNPEIPTFPKGGPRTLDELDKVISWCDLVEMEFGMPFGPTDPRPKPDGRTISQRRRDAIAAATEAEGKAKGRAQRERKARKTERYIRNGT